MRGQNVYSIVWVLVSSLMCCSCATIISGTHQKVSFESIPPGATVSVPGYPDVTTPGSMKLSRKNSYQVVLRKEGYREEQVPIRCEFNLVSLGNILLGGIPGLLVDAADGAMGDLHPSSVNVTLQKGQP